MPILWAHGKAYHRVLGAVNSALAGGGITRTLSICLTRERMVGERRATRRSKALHETFRGHVSGQDQVKSKIGSFRVTYGPSRSGHRAAEARLRATFSTKTSRAEVIKMRRDCPISAKFSAIF